MLEKEAQSKKSIKDILFNFIKINKNVEGKSGRQSKIKIVIVVILIFIVIGIFLSSLKTNKPTEIKKIENKLNALEYCESVENRLISVIGKIKGVGEVDVFVMVDASPTIKYLEESITTTEEKDGNISTSIQTTIVMSKNGSITTPVVVVELMPKITGVLVVATGAKDIKLKTTLINAISAILNVDISSVEVLEGRK